MSKSKSEEYANQLRKLTDARAEIGTLFEKVSRGLNDLQSRERDTEDQYRLLRSERLCNTLTELTDRHLSGAPPGYEYVEATFRKALSPPKGSEERVLFQKKKRIAWTIEKCKAALTVSQEKHSELDHLIAALGTLVSKILQIEADHSKDLEKLHARLQSSRGEDFSRALEDLNASISGLSTDVAVCVGETIAELQKTEGLRYVSWIKPMVDQSLSRLEKCLAILKQADFLAGMPTFKDLLLSLESIVCIKVSIENYRSLYPSSGRKVFSDFTTEKYSEEHVTLTFEGRYLVSESFHEQVYCCTDRFTGQCVYLVLPVIHSLQGNYPYYTASMCLPHYYTEKYRRRANAYSDGTKTILTRSFDDAKTSYERAVWERDSLPRLEKVS